MGRRTRRIQSWCRPSIMRLLVFVLIQAAAGFAPLRSVRTVAKAIGHSSPVVTALGRQESDEKALAKEAQDVEVTPTRPRKKRSSSRMRLFAWLQSPAVEIASAMAVLLSVVLVALGTLDDLDPATEVFLNDSLLVINILFALDFFVRWYAAGQFKAKYLVKPLVIVDIVVVLVPLFLDVILPVLDAAGLLEGGSFLYGLQTSAGLQDLLLLRVLRLRRVLTDVGTFRRFAGALGLKSKDFRPYQLELARVLLSIVTLLCVASGLIYTTEHAVNPGINNYFSALYFGLTSLTTVGFGDIAPVTPQGRLVVSASIIAGIAVIPAQATRLVDALIALQREQQDPVKPPRQNRRRTTTMPAFTTHNLADGKGPSGVPIDEPPQEWSLSGKRSDSIPMDTDRVCNTCQATYHWTDAVFCWSCGSQLPATSLDEPDEDS